MFEITEEHLALQVRNIKKAEILNEVEINDLNRQILLQDTEMQDNEQENIHPKISNETKSGGNQAKQSGQTVRNVKMGFQERKN